MGPPTLTLTGRENDFTIFHQPVIKLQEDKEYEAALLSIDMYYSFPNIADENNKFKYSNDGGQTWKTITLDTGSYELMHINDEIQRQMIINGDYNEDTKECYITITANVTKLKSIVIITNPSYKVDFGVENSIGQILGFSSFIISHGYNESENIVDIMKINSILINIDLISGSYVNGKQSSVIYSFFPNVSPGHKIVERPNPSLIFYPVHKDHINGVRVWITDQDGKPIDLRGERVTLRIQIREVKDVKRMIKQAFKELKNENIL